MWDQKKVLVTGAGGFIGSHLTEALVKARANVRVFLRYNSRDGRGNLEDLDPGLLDGVEIITGDLRDADAIERAVKGCDTVFHLGALVGIPYSYQNPREVVETNIMGTLNILTAARDYGVERIVNTSTSEVYGSALYVPIDEAHPFQGQSPYSASKIGADKLAESFYASYDLPVVTVRPFNCYGPRQSARAIIPTLITQALACKEIRLGNTDTLRDFTYIADTVEGFIKAAQSQSGLGKAINIGSGREISIGQLAQIVQNTVQSNAKIVFERGRVRPRRSEVSRLLADNSLAKKTIGWEPRVSLEEGINLTVVWIAAHMNRFHIGKYQI
ncbi:nucleoside-diphosphate-sugar epimerase [Desulfosporosinus orientis DSM 765]|uniref:Nucleoside-diphosphate-sugar epimerase n=1 Tax=Desulfosporosinus orientis (strain ATCC 19365 / DSM 765 / NCIMB 8382 / VKM B-1628 / Singapore I) TaxID=768706 RepID=G7W533_DESOD|nr:SDR family NAD(P)-dependent oxidoreductase [Desulfosporosinus orientis]AET66049.1 nucleoside-diphosphate-sugar epimerase [Desulfosporosinus orientis DSM 765]